MAGQFWMPHKFQLGFYFWCSQEEVPGHGKWWLDGKTGANKRYCQQCMCCIVMPMAVDSGKKILSAKWVQCNGVTVVVSPADKCIHLLSNPVRIRWIKSKGMQAKREGKVLISH